VEVLPYLALVVPHPLMVVEVLPYLVPEVVVRLASEVHPFLVLPYLALVVPHPLMEVEVHPLEEVPQDLEVSFLVVAHPLEVLILLG